MYRYLLHGPGGDVLGETTCAVLMHAGEEILVGSGRRYRVLDVLPFDDEESSLVASLRVSREALTALLEASSEPRHQVALPNSGPGERAAIWSLA